MGMVLCFSAVYANHEEDHPECKLFKDIYPSPKIMLEEMWTGAFTYEENEELGFTMNFYGKNPNEVVAKRRNDTNVEKYMYDTNQCHLSYFHVAGAPQIEGDNPDTPEKEPEDFTECLAWKDRACCHSETVSSAQKIKEAYGPEYHWDRCGKMSTACERFFVEEACFYECEPTAGLYRKWHIHEYDATKDPYSDVGGNCAEVHAGAEDACEHNKWQMEGMPIKKSYVDAWYAACKNERFCAADNGDYFSCAAEWEEYDDRPVREVEVIVEKTKKELSDGAIVGIAIACVFGLGACGFAVHMIRKERAGEPVFQPLNREEARADANGNKGEVAYTANDPGGV